MKFLFQPPFPETETEILEATFTTIHFVILFFLIILLIYCFKVIRNILPIITVYAFSLIIAMESLTHSHFPISPMFEIFFMIFQTSIFIVSALDYYNNKKVN